MVKDNPLPLTIPIICTGCKTKVEILNNGHLVEFDRLLLNQSAQHIVTIKNNGMIGARWNLTGVENLPQEFQVINTSGELTPTQEARIEIRFKAITEKKFPQKIYLEVQDVENMNIKQEPKEIAIMAEAFDIAVDLKFPDNN